MISKNTEKYCSEPIEWIENYQEAINDKTQVWCCHHRLEIDLHMTREQLKYLGLYYKVPANELIFLTKTEHRRLHFSGYRNPMYNRTLSEETKQKLREANIGKKKSEETKQKIREACKGRHYSEETRRKMSEAHKGKTNPMFGKTHSEVARRKLSEANKGKNNPMYGTHRKCYNNGQINVFRDECPEGFVPGRLKYIK